MHYLYLSPSTPLTCNLTYLFSIFSPQFPHHSIQHFQFFSTSCSFPCHFSYQDIILHPLFSSQLMPNETLMSSSNRNQKDSFLNKDLLFQVYQSIETTFTILDYLIKPVQRVMKYQLLLQSILKYTKKMGEDTASIQVAMASFLLALIYRHWLLCIKWSSI